jgi:diaminopimelate decarboxylase
MRKKIYISGIARCLRKAFPDLSLVGVDHWQGSSGLHESTLDDVLLLPQWSQLNSHRHKEMIGSLLDEGYLWIPSTDMEVRWLAENVASHTRLLAPSTRALEMTEKPSVSALENLGFKVPDFISASLADSEIHTFLRHSSWQCWLKSPYHDAKKVASWGTYERARDVMSRNWRTSRLFIQRNVFGNEESIAFSAYQGELLEAVHMQKRLITPEGKTWAGQVTPVDAETLECFKAAVQEMNWSGGGELEYVRDPDGQKWIIECNPRFPAWIFGSALAGHNLPGKMVAKALGLNLLESVASFPCFTRVVQEIPANEMIGLPLPPDVGAVTWSSDSKKGGGPAAMSLMPKLKDEGESQRNSEPIAIEFLKEVEKWARSFQGETPSRIHLENWTSLRFSTLAENIAATKNRKPEIRIGYSVKTSPTADHLRKARQHGFFSECISQMEIHKALDFGYSPHEVILNGPGKFWPITTPPVMGLHMLFCDSIEEFDRVIQIPKIAKAIGFRMKLPKLSSRFGNTLEEFGDFQRIVSRVRKIQGKAELGFHFHMPSWSIGVERWMDSLQSLLIWCQTIQQVTHVSVKHLDLGGGFFPADLEHLDFKRIQRAVGDALSDVVGLYFEPGRALTQDGEALISRVLDVRKDKEGDVSDIVVDACIAELPLAQAYCHRVFSHSQSQTRLLNKGSTRILGRICMEDDILNLGVDLPSDIAIGDLVIFGDAGGYERTMSYDFGRG